MELKPAERRAVKLMHSLSYGRLVLYKAGDRPPRADIVLQALLDRPIENQVKLQLASGQVELQPCEEQVVRLFRALKEGKIMAGFRKGAMCSLELVQNAGGSFADEMIDPDLLEEMEVD